MALPFKFKKSILSQKKKKNYGNSKNNFTLQKYIIFPKKQSSKRKLKKSFKILLL
jgi:hypothetical protein